jgi:hypothetical protein
MTDQPLRAYVESINIRRRPVMNQYLNEHALLYISNLRHEKATPAHRRIIRVRLNQFLDLIIHWAR